MSQSQTERKFLTDMNWRAVRFFNTYRFFVGLLFTVLVWVGRLPTPIGTYNPLVFSLAIHFYLLFSIFCFWSISRQSPRYALQLNIQVLVDLLVISLLMYSSEGLSSGFGMLLVIAVAGGSILKGGKIAILYAAIATILVLTHELYIDLFSPTIEPNYTHAAFLGITFFITASLGRLLSARVEKSEALASQHAADLESLAQLNEYIVQRMQSGIMVLDEELHIRQINESGRTLLGLSDDVKNQSLPAVAPGVARYVEEWLQGKGNRIVIFRSDAGDIDIQLSFTQLIPETRFGILVFIEDLSLMRQRAQHLKLASLGRLAASIAHEVRNPLGAIMHASQLISEADNVAPENERLLQIITDQSNRVNTIIRNVQDLSRRQAATLQVVDLSKWLDNFVNEFITSHRLGPGQVNCPIHESEVLVNADPDQLFQVISNLAENAVRHGTGNPLVEIQYGVKEDSERPYIDIIDQGHGIPDDNVQHLFEPFFTTHSGGTGLGLYIARELCEANQASLILHKNSEKGCCFRIQFAHIEKQHNLIE
ncbi:MAG TPA: ATP-binding protein [Gammaproteobacteria bacterium]